MIDMENRYLNDKKDNSKIDDGENNSGSPSGPDYPEVDRAIISVYMRTPSAIRLQSFVRDNIFAVLLSIFALIFLFYKCCAAFSAESNCHRRTQDLMFGIGITLFVLHIYTRSVRVRWERRLQSASDRRIGSA
ncbi:hypothetical protein CDV55_103895 [Aspergillus turcosus]|uniref:Uncharacterized protein n=1 Tax=Aspergillus turcosus TaxID=1245748 RepID=A0A229XAG4_9EURO|nr:hypothetical protein CDV55_103895 [Aspergillus turcosus]RLL97868.1 hypothetical protein CFD26_105884 [Aspergillus turcosus]